MIRAGVLTCITLLTLLVTGCSKLQQVRSDPARVNGGKLEQESSPSDEMYAHAHRAAATSLISIVAGAGLGYTYAQSLDGGEGGDPIFLIGAGVAGLVAFISGEVAIFSTIEAGQLANQEWRQALVNLKERKKSPRDASKNLGPLPGTD